MSSTQQEQSQEKTISNKNEQISKGSSQQQQLLISLGDLSPSQQQSSATTGAPSRVTNGPTAFVPTDLPDYPESELDEAWQEGGSNGSSSSSSTDFRIERITDKKGSGKNSRYLVRWFGFGPDEDWWLSRDDFVSPEPWHEYETRLAQMTGSGTRHEPIEDVGGEPLPNPAVLYNMDVCSCCYKGPESTTLFCDGWCQRAYCLGCLHMTSLPKYRWICPDCRNGWGRCIFCGELGVLWTRSRGIPYDNAMDASHSPKFASMKYVHQCRFRGCAAMFHYKCACKRPGFQVVREVDKDMDPIIRFQCSSHLCELCHTFVDDPPAVSCVRCCRVMHRHCFQESNWKRLPDSSGTVGRMMALCDSCKELPEPPTTWTRSQIMESFNPLKAHTGPIRLPSALAIRRKKLREAKKKGNAAVPTKQTPKSRPAKSTPKKVPTKRKPTISGMVASVVADSIAAIEGKATKKEESGNSSSKSNSANDIEIISKDESNHEENGDETTVPPPTVIQESETSSSKLQANLKQKTESSSEPESD